MSPGFASLGKPDGYPWMEPRSCVRNAFLLVTGSSALRYGEGYALTPIGVGRPVWVHHAWVIDAAGNAVDATWRTAGLRYVGIGISVAELQARRLRKRKAHLVEPVLATMLPTALRDCAGTPPGGHSCRRGRSTHDRQIWFTS
jgi:hypothetical protein